MVNKLSPVHILSGRFISELHNNPFTSPHKWRNIRRLW